MTVGLNNTALLDLPLPVEGYFDGSWGDLVNNALTNYLDIAIAGTLTLSGDGAVTLDNTAGDDSVSNISSATLAGPGTATAQYAMVKASGTLTATKVVTVGTSGSPAVSKTYVVDNAATGGTVTFKAYGQTGISVAIGEKCVVYFNGTDFVKVASSVADGVTSVAGTGTVNGITLTGTVTSTGSLTLGGALTGVNLASQVTGTLPIANGGTGSTSTTFVNLASNVTGTLPVANGGTGSTSTTFVNLASNVTGTLPVANGGTGGTTSTGSGAVVLASSPTLITPALGTPASGNFGSGTFTWPTFNQNTTGTAAGLSATLAVASGGTGVTTSTGTGSVVLSASPTLTGTPIAPTAANGTSTTQVATTAYVQNSISAISAGVTSFSAGTTGLTPSTGTSGNVTLSGTLAVANGGTGVTTSTGSGNTVLSTNPTLVAPILGTPTSATLTYATGLPISTGVSGLGTGVATALATNIGAVGSAVTNGGALGTPSSGTLSYATGLPISTGVYGLGTGISTALAANVGSAGAPVLFNGALGTPSSGSLANCTVPVLTTTNFSISEVGGVLVFKYGATTIASMDSSGNLITLANVTAYGTP